MSLESSLPFDRAIDVNVRHRPLFHQAVGDHHDPVIFRRLALARACKKVQQAIVNALVRGAQLASIHAVLFELQQICLALGSGFSRQGA